MAYMSPLFRCVWSIWQTDTHLIVPCYVYLSQIANLSLFPTHTHTHTLNIVVIIWFKQLTVTIIDFTFLVYFRNCQPCSSTESVTILEMYRYQMIHWLTIKIHCIKSYRQTLIWTRREANEKFDHNSIMNGSCCESNV